MKRAIAAAVALTLSTVAAFAQIPVLTPGTFSRLEDLKGRTVLLRGFFSGPVLRYASTGTILEGGKPEAWTLAAVRLEEVKRHGDVLELRGSRMGLHFTGGEVETVERKLAKGRNKFKADNVTIIANLPRADDAAAIELAQQIFLTDAKQLHDVVPDYWQGTVARLTGWTPPDADKKASSEPPRPSGERGQTASVGHTMNEVGTPAPAALPVKVFRVGGGVSPPRLVFNPDPPYVEAARIARIQGTTVFFVIVGREGSVQEVRIARAIGFGLDDNAAATVSKWQFKPAMKDGQPVTVQVQIEVNFRLF